LFDGNKPIDMMRTPTGAALIEEALVGLAHGFSA